MTKKILSILMAISLIAALAVTVSAEDLNLIPGLTSTAPKATVKPVIDGAIDSAWSFAEKQYGTAYSEESAGLNDKIVNSYTSIMWDEQGIYLLGVMYDSTIPETTSSVVNGIDFWISETNSMSGGFDEVGDYHIGLNSNTTLGDYYTGNDAIYEDGVVTYAGQKYDGYFVVEAFCPWQTPGFQPAEGTVMGYNVSFNDDVDMDDSRDMYSYWSVSEISGAYWSETDALNPVTFVAGPVVEEEAPAEEAAEVVAAEEAPASAPAAAPKTADAGIVAALAVMAAAAGVVLSKKH